jgi:hypothetical protein
MVERRSHRISVLIFLFAVFVLLVAFTASWIYRMYQEQTAYSESRTLATVECSRYYFSINQESILYEDGMLYFEIKNTLGTDIDTIVVQSSTEKKEVTLGGLGQGIDQAVNIPLEAVGWAMVYPKGCEGVNFRNITFGQNI